jgi:tetratricopeptide (TPR) repeat protein
MSNTQKHGQDALTEYFFTVLLPFTVKYKKLLIIVAVFTAVLFSCFGFYSMYSEKQEKELLNTIFTELNAKKEIQPSTLEALNREYGDHEASLEIKWRLAGAYIINRQYSKAAGIYREIIDDFPDNPLAAHAVLSLASCYENEEKFNEALELYDQGLERYDRTDIKAYFLYRKAHVLFSMGQYAQSKKTAFEAKSALHTGQESEKTFYDLEQRIEYLIKISTVKK